MTNTLTYAPAGRGVSGSKVHTGIFRDGKPIGTLCYNNPNIFLGFQRTYSLPEGTEITCKACNPEYVETDSVKAEKVQRSETRAQVIAANSAKREAKAIYAADGSPLKIRYESKWAGDFDTETLKTAHAARQWLISSHVNQQYWLKYESHQSLIDAREIVLIALADKAGRDLEDYHLEIEKAAFNSAKRSGLL